MTEWLNVLEGISYKEWEKLKMIIDDEFTNIKEKSTFHINEDTFNRINTINLLESFATAHKQ